MSDKEELVGVGMRDVARRAGVSAVTVSRVLANSESVSTETRERVMSAVKELGYIRNHLARSFGNSRSRLVGVVVPTVANLMFADKIESLVQAFLPHDYQLLVANNAYSIERETEIVEALMAQRPAGIILTGVTHSRRTRELLRRSRTPTVETWNLCNDPIDMLVGFSNRNAAATMVHMLFARGYRDIAFVHPVLTSNDRALDRRDGYRQALAELGVPFRHDREISSPFGFASGAEALGKLLDQSNPPDAIFFGNDALAIGALLECRRRKIDVPGEIGIAGFDDVDLASQIDPTLTTVRIPMREMGQKAAELLLDRLSGKPRDGQIWDLGFSMVERGSTKQ